MKLNSKTRKPLSELTDEQLKVLEEAAIEDIFKWTELISKVRKELASR